MKRLSLVVAVLAMSACSVLEPKPDGSRYFLLRSLAAPGAGPALTELVVGLGPVTVPGYLDQSDMVDLVGPYEVRYSAQNRWVEPLGTQMHRTLAENLDVLLQPAAIVEYPWFDSEGVDLAVEVDFAPIRMDEEGAWAGAVRWVLRDPVTNAPLERSDFRFQLGRDSIPPDVIASGLSEQLGGLSDEIAGAVRRHYRGN